MVWRSSRNSAGINTRKYIPNPQKYHKRMLPKPPFGRPRDELRTHPRPRCPIYSNGPSRASPKGAGPSPKGTQMTHQIIENHIKTSQNPPWNPHPEQLTKKCRPENVESRKYGFSLESECHPAKLHNHLKGYHKSTKRQINVIQSGPKCD